MSYKWDDLLKVKNVEINKKSGNKFYLYEKMFELTPEAGEFVSRRVYGLGRSRQTVFKQILNRADFEF